MNRSGTEQTPDSTLPATAETPEGRQAIPEEMDSRTRDKTQPMPMGWRRPAESVS
jgi:hypothetical protein